MSSILLVPGLHNSGPEHWQSHWHRRYPDWQRVQDQTWHDPQLDQWADRVAAYLSLQSRPVHLVAHSFGTLASLVAAARHPDKVASLFLVAPADPARFGIADADLPIIPSRPGRVIASRNDPWMSFERAEYWSQRWQFPLLDAGHAGHINADSGHGAWPEGLAWLAAVLQQADAPLGNAPRQPN